MNIFDLQFNFKALIPYAYLLPFSLLLVATIGIIVKVKEWYLSLITIALLAIYYNYYKVYLSLPNALIVIFVVAIILLLLLFSSKAKKAKQRVVKESYRDVKIETRQQDVFLENIFSGLLLYGSAGSGKTASIIYPVLKHFSKYEYSGIVYDYKNGELTEMLYDLFDNVNVIAVHNPTISIRVNPIDPTYIKEEADAGDIAKVLVLNLLGGKQIQGGGDFFVETSEALLSAVILKLALDHPTYCTLPHVIALILAVDFSINEEEKRHQEGAPMTGGGNLGDMALDTFAKLKNFLTSNLRVKIQASSFVLGLANARQTASVISTLANLLRKVSSPNLFWVLSKAEYDLSLNTKKGNIVSVLNNPSKDNYLSPVLALIIQSITKRMMERQRNQSFLLLDEAPTIKLQNMARIPATMRSFNIATVYCAQDMFQGFNQYTRDGFKEITANLSNVILGKANNSETGKDYEVLMEKIKEQQRSTNKSTNKTGWSKGYSLSEKEVSKLRAHDFTLLQTGEFVFLVNGIQEKLNVKLQDITTKEMPVISGVTEEEILNNFEKIVKDVNALISVNYDY